LQLIAVTRWQLRGDSWCRWAYPGMPKFSRVSRLFDAGDYDKFEQAVGPINRVLTTESYRTGDVEHAGL